MGNKESIGEAGLQADLTAVRSAADRIVKSSLFAHSDRQRRFLQFIVDETLAGRADRLKGYTLGIEVFGRDHGFDPVSDPIVRVEAGRLRAKLREYYDGEGRLDPVHIDVPKGSYAITIRSEGAVGGEKSAWMRETVRNFEEKPSVVVLPFADEGGEPEQQYFSDGITDDIITDLSKISGLFVLCRHTSFAYRHTDKRSSAIAEELGVRYFVTGSVRRADNRLRISAQLVDTRSDRTLWAERYDRSLDDVFTVQDDVSHAIVDALKIKLTSLEAERLGYEGTASPAAHDALMRGLECHWRYTREGSFEAEAHFKRAIELDPAYALAHAWLARCYTLQWSQNWVPIRERTLDPALIHAERAVELDELLPIGHSILGWVQLWRNNAASAVAETRRACMLDPNDADAYLFASFSLCFVDRAQEALHHIETAMHLNPQPSTFYFFGLANCLFATGAYEQALAPLKRGVELNPMFLPNHLYLAVVQALLGHEKEARDAAAQMLQISPQGQPGSNISLLSPAIMEQFERGERLAGLLH